MVKRKNDFRFWEKMILNLEDKNILIVGGSKGIGKQIAIDFLESGSNVSIISRTKPQNNLLKQKKCNHYICDVTDFENYSKIASEIIKDFNGFIDVLIFAVGSGAGDRVVFSKIQKWNECWDLNFRTALYTANLFENFFNKENISSLIFIGSIAGIEIAGAPDCYSVAKSSLVAFSKSLSKNLSPSVRVNIISPGNIFIENGTWDLIKKEKPHKVDEMINKNVPLKRFGKAEDVSNLVLFISSEKASFITGSNIVIDGGQTNFF
jgi:3-oxoacyl-[acyl-carrier protein] reductase